METRETKGRSPASALFDSRADADQAIRWLRSNGVPDDSISVLTRHEEAGVVEERPGAERREGEEAARGAGRGMLAGAGVGALFGLAAAAIPGIGPFITAGWLATTLGAAGGAAVAGAVVGGTAGALAGALARAGFSREEAEFYAAEVDRGGTLVTVDLAGTALNRADVENAFRRFNGRLAAARA